MAIRRKRHARQFNFGLTIEGGLALMFFTMFLATVFIGLWEHGYLGVHSHDGGQSFHSHETLAQ